ncbi:hypothetical protein T265_02611 [Opisthorchis viverrini]|uniref:Uncharacterized protein n=1 Tax=Opisthorchis viverrini TaxID=6198 RepID=A0A074ZYH9_OPIVI|nr:hypothetical protein T265_02611 [Opisthorchis viverrini]KER31047.1 hypothetical protein T265_02611 [Opisthorchis viverrini]
MPVSNATSRTRQNFQKVIAAYSLSIYMKPCTSVPDFVLGVNIPSVPLVIVFDVNASLAGSDRELSSAKTPSPGRPGSPTSPYSPGSPTSPRSPSSPIGPLGPGGPVAPGSPAAPRLPGSPLNAIVTTEL